MKKYCMLFLSLLLCAFQGTNTPRDKALESLAEAERHFSAASKAKGLHQAFVENMAPDGLVFAPGPVNGRKLHAAAPASKALLTWYPVYADISSSLDWGYTTGPYQLLANPDDGKVTGAGFYLSVWKKQQDGTWQVAVDMGNSFSPDLLKEEAYLAAESSGKQGKGDLQDLLQKDVQKVQPYHEETLVYRAGKYPYRYTEASVEPAASITYTTLGHDISPAQDMAYTYGSYTRKDNGKGETGHYLKVWKVLDGQWQLVAHNLVPDKKQ